MKGDELEVAAKVRENLTDMIVTHGTPGDVVSVGAVRGAMGSKLVEDVQRELEKQNQAEKECEVQKVADKQGEVEKHDNIMQNAQEQSLEQNIQNVQNEQPIIAPSVPEVGQPLPKQDHPQPSEPDVPQEPPAPQVEVPLIIPEPPAPQQDLDNQ